MQIPAQVGRSHIYLTLQGKEATRVSVEAEVKVGWNNEKKGTL